MHILDGLLEMIGYALSTQDNVANIFFVLI
jgi:hypothetical protein